MSDDTTPIEFSNSLTVRSLKDYTTGAGYDSLKYDRSSTAIKKADSRKGGTTKNQFTIWVATSARELIDKMTGEMDLRAHYMGAEAGVAAELISTFELSETSVIIIARQKIEAKNQTIADEPLQLADDAKEKLLSGTAEDLAQFHRKHGGYFCHTVVMGGELYVAYQCVATTTKRATEIKGKIDVSVPDVGSLMASMSSIMSDSTTTTRWQMTAQSQGAGGTIGSFDPKDPASVQAAIMEFMKEFEENVRKEPEPYYGLYDGYWRQFDEAEPLKIVVAEASKKVENLSDWAAYYADSLATINAFLDPKSAEGYLVTDALGKKIDKLKQKIDGLWTVLRDKYDFMELLKEFQDPSEIAELKDYPPGTFDAELETIRKDLLSHLIKVGQSVRITLTEPGKHVHNKFIKSGATTSDQDPDEWPGEGEYVYLAKNEHTNYVLKPVSKKVGEDLCHGDVINLVHNGKGKLNGQMIYMPNVTGVWAVRLFDYVKSHHEKYEWRVNIEGCKDKTRRVTTTDTLWLTNMNDESCYLCVNSTYYLGVTKSDRDEWKIGLTHWPR